MISPTKNRRWLRLAAPGVLLVAAIPAPILAQEAAGASADADQTVVLDTSASISTQAQAVLDRMSTSLGALQDYSVSAHITRDELLPFGYKLQNNESAQMWVTRPNRLRLEVEGDIKNRTYVYDGSQLTLFAPDYDAYASAPAPDTLGGLVEVLMDAGVEMPLIDLLYHGYSGSLTENVRVGILVGESSINGVATDHLAFRQADVDWQLWVTRGAQALPVKFLITTRYEVGDPQYQANLSWDLKPRIDAKTFKFTPPADATKIPFAPGMFAAGEAK